MCFFLWFSPSLWRSPHCTWNSVTSQFRNLSIFTISSRRFAIKLSYITMWMGTDMSLSHVWYIDNSRSTSRLITLPVVSEIGELIDWSLYQWNEGLVAWAIGQFIHSSTHQIIKITCTTRPPPKITARRDEKHLRFGIWCAYIRGLTVVKVMCYLPSPGLGMANPVCPAWTRFHSALMES